MGSRAAGRAVKVLAIRAGRKALAYKLLAYRPRGIRLAGTRSKLTGGALSASSSSSRFSAPASKVRSCSSVPIVNRDRRFFCRGRGRNSCGSSEARRGRKDHIGEHRYQSTAVCGARGLPSSEQARATLIPTGRWASAAIVPFRDDMQAGEGECRRGRGAYRPTSGCCRVAP